MLLDDQGRPYDFAYRYINAAAAALTGHVAEDLLGEEAYALWGGDPIWLDDFYEAAYKGRASEFEAPSEMLQQFFRAEVFPISEGLCRVHHPRRDGLDPRPLSAPWRRPPPACSSTTCATARCF